MRKKNIYSFNPVYIDHSQLKSGLRNTDIQRPKLLQQHHQTSQYKEQAEEQLFPIQSELTTSAFQFENRMRRNQVRNESNPISTERKVARHCNTGKDKGNHSNCRQRDDSTQHR